MCQTVPTAALLLLLLGRSNAYVPWNEEEDYFTETLVGQAQAGAIDGPRDSSMLNLPDAIAVDYIAQHLYIADRGNHRIRVVNVAAGNKTSDDDYITTLAGGVQGYADGIGVAAMFSEPAGLAVDSHTRLLFVSDSGNSVIRKVDLDSLRVTTIAGSQGVRGFINGAGRVAAFQRPTGLALALRSRQLFVCDPFNHAVRTVNVLTEEVRTLAGAGVDGHSDGPGDTATFHRPQGVALNADETTVFVVDESARVRMMPVAEGPAFPAKSDAQSFTTAVYTLLDGSRFHGRVQLQQLIGVGYAFGWPGGGALILVDSQGNRVYRLSLGMELAEADRSGEQLSAFASTSAVDFAGTWQQQQRGKASGFAVCGQGIAGATGEQCHPYLSLLAGSTPGMLDGMGLRTRFYRPHGVAVDYETRSIYVADTYNHRVRVMLMTDQVDEIVQDVEQWYEFTRRALEQNLVFILSLVGGLLGLCCCTYIICRYCSFCPVYQRRLHAKRLRTMEIGNRV